MITIRAGWAGLSGHARWWNRRNALAQRDYLVLVAFAGAENGPTSRKAPARCRLHPPGGSGVSSVRRRAHGSLLPNLLRDASMR